MTRLIAVLFVFLCVFSNLWSQNQVNDVKNFNVTFFVNETNPMGQYKEFADFGIGGGIWIDYIIPGEGKSKVSPYKMGVGGEYVYNFTNKIDFQRLEDFHLYGRAAITLIDSDNVDFGAGIRAGLVTHMLRGTWAGDSATTEIFHDPFIAFDVEIKIDSVVQIGGSDVGLLIVPGYQLFVEEKYNGQQVIIKAGLLFAF